MRKTKVRINIISVLVGGEEDSTQRTESTKLMKTISHITGGTFMQLWFYQYNTSTYESSKCVFY